MEKFTDQNYLRSDQYKTNENLSTRVNLHSKYSTNTYGLHKWAFDQYIFPKHCKILEIGCGAGDLWVENKTRIPMADRLVLSDYSPGMLEGAKKRLSAILPVKTEYRVVDVQNIPFVDESFDMVIANHMLYHVPDVVKAISEIHRILVPNGVLYANTNGERHMEELYNLMHSFDNSYDNKRPNLGFSLENGLDLVKAFSECSMVRYENYLLVTNANDLLSYQLSLITNSAEFQTEEYKKRLLDYFQGLIVKDGSIKITTDAGLIKAVK